MSKSDRTSQRIGVFDSGVGGLSVVRALWRLQPGGHFHYFADSGHAPYGDRSDDHAVHRSLVISEHLLSQGAGMIVVACNTATAAAIEALRERYPHLPLVGVEPGIKPAALQSGSGRIGVLATPSTLKSLRYQQLLSRFATGCDVTSIACTGLAAAIEMGHAGREEVQRLLDAYIPSLIEARVDTVVLGCTHYPFIGSDIAQRLGPSVTLIDTSEAVARQVARLAQAQGLLNPERQLSLTSSGDPRTLALMCQDWLGCSSPVEQA